jgi:hypothetical protein
MKIKAINAEKRGPEAKIVTAESEYQKGELSGVRNFN